MSYQHLSTKIIGSKNVVTLINDTIEMIDECTYPDSPTLELIDEFADAVRRGTNDVVLDARRVNTLNHASLDLLFKLARSANECGRKMTICCKEPVKEVWDLCRGDGVPDPY